MTKAYPRLGVRRVQSPLGRSADEEIAAGTTKTFRLSFDATGASSVSDDTLRFDIPDEAEADALTTARNAIEWEDANTAATDIVGTSVDNLPINGGALLF